MAGRGVCRGARRPLQLCWQVVSRSLTRPVWLSCAELANIIRGSPCVRSQSGKLWNMTILIENAETHEYLSRDGRWTRKMEQAATFRTSTLAKESALAFPIGVFNVIGTFQTSAQLVNLDAGCGGKK